MNDIATADISDIAIIGGGPVGAALACALHGSHLKVAVLEARVERDADVAHANPRPIAISYGSRLLLERLGAWQGLAPTPIQQVHVSQRGGFGRAALSAHQTAVPALGYAFDYKEIFYSLAQAARGGPARYCDGANVTAIHRDGDHSHIDYLHNGASAALHARLVVVADGGDIDGLAPTKTHDYQQTALTGRVRATVPHGNTAYERFTPEGPLALLPFGDEMALVWTLAPARAQLLMAVPDAEFIAALRAAFGGRVGEFTAVSARASFPLTLRTTTSAAAPGVVCIGNAAQTLHPVAGQGFNLGLRDAWELAQLLRTVPVHAIADPQTLRRYTASRSVDRKATVGATHGLVQLFSNDFFMLNALRGAGMTLLGSVAPARDFLARRMMFGARG